MFETNEIYFIRIFFRILFSFFVVFTISMFVFRINDSVVFQTGEILSENPQLDYKAAFEAIPDKVYVKEGQTVKAGDTLMVLHSEQIRKDFDDAKVSVTSLQQTVRSISELRLNAFEKIKNLQREKQLNTRTHESQREKLRNELKSASEKSALASEQMSTVGLTKLKIDSTLYRQNVISKLDITNSYDVYSNYKNSFLQSELTKNQIQSASNNIDNDYLKTQNALDLKLIELQERLKELERQKADADKQLTTAEDNLNYLRTQTQKQYIIAETDGEVQNLHNLKFKANFINKDELLLSVTPKKGKFFAKVTIPQRDMRHVKVGQDAHLKVEVFNFYDQGVLKGNVSYVPEAKPKEDFFVIIDLSPNKNFKLKPGYAIRGEIIVERLSIFKFAIKKLFRKVTDASTPATTTAS